MKPQIDIGRAESIEKNYWRAAPDERPGSKSLDNLVNKVSDVGVLLERMRQFDDRFRRASRIVELGAGQGWASCVIKRLFPSSEVIATDIGACAVASASMWERLFEVRLDMVAACRSYELPLASNSADIVFAFQSAHHFRAHRRTLREAFRVLRPGGSCIYMHEPSCRAYIHSLAHWRVNAKRPEVPEDVIVFDRLTRLAEEIGFAAHWSCDFTLTKRAPLELIYYNVLRTVPGLSDVLPCTRDFVFEKP